MTDQPTQPAETTTPASSAVGQPTTPHSMAVYGQGQLAPTPGQPSLGKIRSTGLCILLAVVTLGFYTLYWYFSVHDEMKRHSRNGLGGGIALLLAFFVGFVMPYITSSEVGHLYEGRGQRRPVSGATGLWYFPGVFILVGPLVWFIKTNGAINAYWRSCGVR